ncbi:hypothetical protein VTO42DRAFT_9012 [Malbranchea cinnamomea]
MHREWILDSGSSSHATPDPTVFTSWSRDSPGMMLTMANKSTSKVDVRGTAEVRLDGGTLTLNGARLVRGLGANLISLGQLVREGYSFNQIFITIESPDRTLSFNAELTDDSVWIIREALRPARLLCYTIPTSNTAIRPEVVATSVEAAERDNSLLSLGRRTPHTVTGTMESWHRHLGHLNERDIAALTRDPRTGIRISGVKLLGFYDTCKAAKMVKKPFKPMTRYT